MINGMLTNMGIIDWDEWREKNPTGAQRVVKWFNQILNWFKTAVNENITPK